MIREIVTYDIHRNDNNEILHRKLRTVTDFKAEETLDCIRDLNDTLDEVIAVQGNRRGAIGLSANQIDYDLAISAVTLKDQRYILINPRIMEEKGKERLFRIGCFSVEEYRALVRYNDDVLIAYQDAEGREQTLSLQGDQSCVVQHEMDHLKGMLLFEKAEDRKRDFFIPRETIYKDGNIHFRNHGLIFELRRKLGMQDTLSAPAFYSALFNDYTDYVAYVDKYVQERKELQETVRRHVPSGDRILEAGCGTSALSVALSREGYRVSCCEEDGDMLELARSINAQNQTGVDYHLADMRNLPFADKSFSAIFSYEVLETLEDAELLKALQEGLRVADKYIFQVPTIRIKSNALKGNERLRSSRSWDGFLTDHGFRIMEEKAVDQGGSVIYVIQ